MLPGIRVGPDRAGDRRDARRRVCAGGAASGTRFPPSWRRVRGRRCRTPAPARGPWRRENCCCLTSVRRWTGTAPTSPAPWWWGRAPTSASGLIHELVQTAQRRAIEHLRPGMTGREGDALAREVIATRGFGEAFGHSLGHGLGLEVHEAPRLSPNVRRAVAGPCRGHGRAGDLFSGLGWGAPGGRRVSGSRRAPSACRTAGPSCLNWSRVRSRS